MHAVAYRFPAQLECSSLLFCRFISSAPAIASPEAGLPPAPARGAFHSRSFDEEAMRSQVQITILAGLGQKASLPALDFFSAVTSLVNRPSWRYSFSIATISLSVPEAGKK